MNSFFEIIRAGINTTFQDNGRNNLYHVGIPFSGAMDKRNYILAICLVGNQTDKPVIEFAYQGPLVKYQGEKINFAITGDVIFKLIKKENEIIGNCYENYLLEDGDQIDIISTNKSVYGYLAISGEFELEFQWGSCSINTKANIGSNNGKKIQNNQKIDILNINQVQTKKKLNYINTKIEKIRVIKGTNFNFFSEYFNHWVSIFFSFFNRLLLIFFLFVLAFLTINMIYLEFEYGTILVAKTNWEYSWVVKILLLFWIFLIILKSISSIKSLLLPFSKK